MKDFEETKSGNVASWESNAAEQSWHQPLLFPLADCANSTDAIDSCDCETCYVEAFNDGYGYGADDGLEEGLTAAIEEIENIMTEFEESQYSMDTVLHRLGEVVLSLQIMYPIKEEEIDTEHHGDVQPTEQMLGKELDMSIRECENVTGYEGNTVDINDVQRSTILTGQTPERRSRMSDHERDDAGNEASCENDNVEHHGDSEQTLEEDVCIESDDDLLDEDFIDDWGGDFTEDFIEGWEGGYCSGKDVVCAALSSTLRVAKHMHRQ